MSDQTPSPRNRTAKRIAAGVALAVLPAGALHLFLNVHESSEQRDRALEKGTAYDLTNLQKVDPALIRFTETGRIETGLAKPRTISLDSAGNLLVAGDQSIKRIGLDARAEKHEIKLADSPFCVFGAEDGWTYVGLKDRVEVYGVDGVKKAAWPSLGRDAYLTAIAVFGEDVYLADSGRRLLIHTDRAGSILNEIGRGDPKTGVEGLLLPSPHLDVAVAADGTIWLNDTGRHRLENYTKDGRLERFWGTQGTGIQAFPGCCNPTDFFLMRDGRFITAEKGIARVKRYLADGRFDCVVAAPSAFAGNVVGLDVVVDSAGRVLVLERGTSVVRIFEERTDLPLAPTAAVESKTGGAP